VIAVIGGEGDIITGGGGPADFLSIGTPMFASDRVAADIACGRQGRAHQRHRLPGRLRRRLRDRIRPDLERGEESARGRQEGRHLHGLAAASGGYYVSAAADMIVATRSTVTGSIGVFGGKFAIAEALGEFGINPDIVSVGGEYASAYSTERLTAVQREKLTASLKGTYDRFTGIVAEGRGIPLAKVQEIARGRVWSGEDALANGLVDKTGDLIVAIEEAVRLAGFKPEDGYQLRLNVQDTTPFDLLMGAMAQSTGPVSQQQLLQGLAGVVGKDRAAAMLRQLSQAGQPPSAQVWMPPVSER
jgi:protease-4